MDRTAVAYLRPGQPLPRMPPGVTLCATVVEHDPAGRDGLRAAVAPLAEGEADALLTTGAGSLTRSLPELVRLLDWLEAAGASLICLEPPLDTATSPGRATVALLREIAGWERPRGRPGLAHADPALAERIASLREAGLSLQAIADRLTDDGVPTPRGGRGWRPSSVQSALGYRRPRPPVIGHPPPRHRRPDGPR